MAESKLENTLPTFDGRPAGYRTWRRKLLLYVGRVEDKRHYLLGPHILGHLSGDAWDATEHINVARVRNDTGWIKVLKILDKHYKYQAETELNDSAEEFLF